MPHLPLLRTQVSARPITMASSSVLLDFRHCGTVQLCCCWLQLRKVLYDKFPAVKMEDPLHHSDSSLYFFYPLLICLVWRIAFQGHNSKKIDHCPYRARLQNLRMKCFGLLDPYMSANLIQFTILEVFSLACRCNCK